MNWKMIVFLACAGYGIWFAAVGGKKLDEDIVREVYRQASIAFIRNDGEAYCKLIDDDISGISETRMPAMPAEKQAINKENACASVGAIHAMREQMERVAREAIHINYEQKINSITLSPDREIATIEFDDEIRIGTERGALLIMQTRQTDKIRRSFGKAKIFQSNGSIRILQGARQ